MKATGIVRKIDELGRIVIPKEIRKTMKIKEGESLEIYVENDDEVILKKYDPMSEQKSQLENYAQTLAEETGLIVLVTDTKEVVISCGKNSKGYANNEISQELEKVINKRNFVSSKDIGIIKLVEDDKIKDVVSQAIAPIISDSDLMGSVILISKDMNRQITQNDLKILQISKNYLARLFE